MHTNQISAALRLPLLIALGLLSVPLFAGDFALAQFPEMEGFPVAFEEDVYVRGGMNVGDLDGDGDFEMCFGTNRGALFVYQHTGAVMDGWPVGMEGGAIHSIPAFLDIEDDGDLEIFITSGPYLHAFEHEGEPVEGWPVLLDHSVESDIPPAVGDLDGDGDFEIVHGAYEHPCYVFAWHHDGSPVDGWPVQFPPGYLDHCDVIEPPALGDLDGDGTLEVVVGTRGAQVYVLRHDGSDFPGWPKEGLYPTSSFSSPVIGDIDGNGEDDIVLASSYETVWAWDIYGNPKPGWPWSAPDGHSASGVILADLAGDPALEVIVNSWLHIYVVDGATGTVLLGWPQPEGSSIEFYRSAVASDIDDDDEREIILAGYEQDWPNPITGYIFAWDPDGAVLDGFPIVLESEAFYFAPAISDLDGDGDLEICVTSGSYLHAWDLPNSFKIDRGDWPLIYHDSFHTNDFGLLLPTEHPIDVDLLPDSVTVRQGESFTLTASLANMNVVYESFFAGLFLRPPGGGPYFENPLLGPYSLRLRDFSDVRVERTLAMPQGAPPGEYHLILPAGRSVHTIMDVDSTIVHVVQ